MPYARLDDRWDDHRKIKRAWRRHPAAVGLHAMAITYCNRHNNNGEVDSEWVDEKLALLPCKANERAKILETLVELNMFERVDADTFRVHDFLDWNLSRDQRAQLAEQGRRGGRSGRGGSRGPESDGSSPGSSNRSSQGLGEGSSPPDDSGSSTPTPRHATPTPSNKEADASLSGADRADEKASPDDRRLCRLLADLAKERNSKFKVKRPSRWLTDMRLLRERDGNGVAEIEEAIRWVFLDDFWGGIIQSPGGLREHFASIWDRMHGGNVVPIARRENASDLLRAINGGEPA